jgi:hypothetical protein
MILLSSYFVLYSGTNSREIYQSGYYYKGHYPWMKQ